MDPAVWGGGRSQARLWDWGQKLRENEISPRCPSRRRKKKAGAAQSTDATAYCRLSEEGRNSSRVRERGSSCSSSSRFVLQARSCNRQWPQLLVMMKNCWLSLGVSSASLFLRWQSEQRGDGWNGWIGVDDPMEIGRCEKGCSWTRP